MAKRGPRFKAPERVSIECVLEALADVALERRKRRFVEAGGKLEAFISLEIERFREIEGLRCGNRRSIILATIKQIKAHRENGFEIWLDMCPPKKRKKKDAK